MTAREKILLGILGILSVFYLVNRKYNVVGSIVKMTESLIEGFEGRSRTAYPDAGGHSIGVGHFIQPGEEWMLTATLSDSQIDSLFAKDSQKAANAVSQYVKVPLNDNQKAALTSLIFNIGVGNFSKSTLLKKLNAGDYQGAANQFDAWRTSGGKVSSALVTRRAKEKELFLS